ncbi:aminotransferase class V-fold PLP-dependent enzyme [Actinomycetospora termitidis]|uniref:Aminotransferase class V-fold PLP-dependent enzyme n=1 Tax=Actinomycetospora termitidis TaxID=3053470 RepID=A0ABT7MHC9_9PSEU|nr:aminotransferase class V-fold PLP-dependent enzyme [Actinomycetospora sp. Odt1-22]MDL5160087.1 aminotransferase class V-fold PLP-dependent enzyme [Actinomycetospora sp. Odt1-22]
MTAVLSPALPPTVGADLEVPLVDGRRVRYADLDAAASAPPLRAVADHVAEVLPYYASVHRGAGYTSRVCTSLLESARDTVGHFVGSRVDDVVVFTRNTTDALALLARAVPGPVLTLDLEHHATLLAWRHTEHHVVAARRTVAATLDALREGVRTHRPALVAVTGASNVTGETLPLTAIVELAHAAGARVAIDAAQLAPHRRVDLAALGADYLALSGHKLYAPYGAGVLVGRRDWLDAAPAHLAGGGAVRSVAVADGATDTAWLPAPQRHEGGTPNLLGAVALAAACRALEPVVDTVVPAHERALAARLRDSLSDLPGVRLLECFDDAPDQVAVVSFDVEALPAGLVAAALSAEFGIGVRDGRFCAHPLLDRLTGGGDAVRASLGLATVPEDVERLIAAVARLVERGPGWTYAQRDGRWVPTPDPRDLDPLRVGARDGLPGCDR